VLEAYTLQGAKLTGKTRSLLHKRRAIFLRVLTINYGGVTAARCRMRSAYLIEKPRKALARGLVADRKPLPHAQRWIFCLPLVGGQGRVSLPQLFNVLVGDMSLIGPRPLLPHDQPPTSLRLTVLPGITGWAQVGKENLHVAGLASVQAARAVD
jgi:hypothetical protein